MKMLLNLLALALLTSCASHSFMRGTVAMKTDKSTGHICLGDNDVKVGDKLQFYTNKCHVYGGAGEGGSDCELKELGIGTVTKLLNSHYSEVKTDGSFKFKEGTLVQKMR